MNQPQNGKEAAEKLAAAWTSGDAGEILGTYDFLGHYVYGENEPILEPEASIQRETLRKISDLYKQNKFDEVTQECERFYEVERLVKILRQKLLHYWEPGDWLTPAKN